MNRIVIADDDMICREVMQNILGGEEYSIETASDGEEVLAIARKAPPDLLLLDIDMPKLDGVAVLKALKADPETQDIPVIMVTAINADSQIAMCLDLGAVDHVVKPYSSTVVRARVRSVLRNRDDVQGVKQTAAQPGKVISFLGVKGGVGTSMVALNVASALAMRNANIALCELRPDMGTLGFQFLLSPDNTIAALLERKPARITPKDLASCCVKQPSGINLLLTTQLPEKAVLVNEEEAKEIALNLKYLGDYVFVDLPNIPLPMTSMTLLHSDYVILVTELEPNALSATKITYHRLLKDGVLANRMGMVVCIHNAASSPISLKQLKDMIDCPLIGVIPPDAESLMLASKKHIPVIQALPDSNASSGYLSLSRRFLENRLIPLEF